MAPDGNIFSRDSVFVAGGQPSVTYIEREGLDIERHLARAIAAPNQIVSLSGPTKCGKTVLCRRVLGEQQYVWIEGGQIENSAKMWERVCYELNYPIEIRKAVKDEFRVEASGGLKFIASAAGSHLSSTETARTYQINNMATALEHLIKNRGDYNFNSADFGVSLWLVANVAMLPRSR